MKKFDREELAWAAGFFDGEGSFINPHYQCPTLRVKVSQTHPEVLQKFKHAVCDLGKLNGPYVGSGKHKPVWIFQSGKFEHSQAVIALLWNWLWREKRNQAFRALSKANKPKIPKPLREFCDEGHNNWTTWGIKRVRRVCKPCCNKQKIRYRREKCLKQE